MTIKHWKFLLPLSLVHAVLLFFRIGQQSLWLDEVMGLTAVRGSWSHLWGFFAQVPEQHPLYYLIMRAWLVFGTSEMALRSLSAVFALASLWAIYLLALKLFDESIARVTAVMLCFSPFFVFWGQEARMYSMLAFLTTFSSLLFLRWLESGRRRTLVAYGIVALLGAYTHFFFLFVLAAHLAFLARRERSLTPAVKRLLLVQGIVGLAYLPWAVRIMFSALETRTHKGAEYVVLGIPYALFRFSLGYSELAPSYEWKTRVWQLLSENAPLLALAVLCFATLILVGVQTTVRRGGVGHLILWGAALPPLLGLLVSVIVIPQGERYLMVSFPSYLMLLAAGMVALLRGPGARRWTGRVAVVAYVVLMGHALRGYYFDPAFGKEQWREVAEHLRAQSRPDDVIVVHRGFATANLKYYYEITPGQRLFPSDSLKPEELQTANRVWLVLRDPASTDEYAAAMQPRYRVVSDRLFLKQSGIRVLLMVRS